MSLPTVEELLDELRKRGWAGGEHKSLAIHLEWDAVVVELTWVGEANTTWGNTTQSMNYVVAPTLQQALLDALELATPNPPEEED